MSMKTKNGSAHTIYEMQNNLCVAKTPRNRRSTSTNIALTKTNRKSVSLSEIKIYKHNCTSDIYKSFQLPKFTRSCIPTLINLKNETNLNEKNRVKWTGLVNMSVKCLEQIYFHVYVQD